MGSIQAIPDEGMAPFIQSMSDMNPPSAYDRIGSQNSTQFHAQPRATQRALKAAYEGIWSIEMPTTLGPHPRYGHFTCYDNESRAAYIGYGISPANDFFRDLWRLDTLSGSWKQIRLSGAEITPRSGSSALFYKNVVVVFGGFANGDYKSDLHTINVSTGVVSVPETHGEAPAPRSTPMVGIHANKLCIWGGFAYGEYVTTLSVLDLGTMTWRHVQTDVQGRTAAPFVQVDSKIFSFGGSRCGGILSIDIEEEKVEVINTVGTNPQSGVHGAGMVKAGEYLFYFGGKADNSYTLLYALDTKRWWWFVFHVKPDFRTVSLEDGRVVEMLFMLPRMHNFSMCYVSEKRTIIAFLGSPHQDPPPLFTISVGAAFGVLNVRQDMRDMFSLELSLFGQGNGG